MYDICGFMDPSIREVGRAQDTIGWRRFMEGMVTSRIRTTQQAFWRRCSWRGNVDKWIQTLMVKLMECTHGQWLYRNVMVHDRWNGTVNRLRKEELLKEIETQMEMEKDDLLPEDQYLLEINLGDIQQSSGDREEYWLMAVKAARVAKQLTQGIG